METTTHRRVSVSIGTVREADEGETPTVTVSDGQALNFVLPRGIAGPQGEKGEKGDRGEPGSFSGDLDEIDATGIGDLCDEVLDESGEYVRPDPNVDYYVGDKYSIKPLLQRLKAFFTPQSRTINGKSLAANVLLTAEDIANNVLITKRSVTLASGSWSSKAQTVTVSGVTENNTILVTPAPASYLNYHKWKVRCTAQAANKLTFTAGGEPSENLTVQILIINGVT